jgi:hypothetical protein
MKPEERFRDYAPLAWFYDRYWGERYHALVLPILDRLLLRRLPPATSPLLDLCCGTGTSAAAPDISNLGMPGDLGLGRIFFRAEI